MVALAIAAFVSPAAAQPLPGGFVFLRDIDPTIIQDIRYAGSNNFVGRPLGGYEAAECVVKRDVGLALKTVQQELAAQKLSLKMLDCYRPARAVADMVAWAQNGKETANKAYADCTAPANTRSPEGSVDMGTGYDCSDVKAHTAARSVTPAQRRWRNLLVAAMARQGFVNYAKEWWHFSLPGAAGPAYDFPISARRK